MELAEADPKGLVRESYRIEGITLGECRSIFMDWALSLKVDADHGAAIRKLLDHYGPGAESHPMTVTLREGLGSAAPARRRGGRLGRQGG